MIEPAVFYETLRGHGLTFFAGVPDSLLKDLCAYIAERTPDRDHVITANEGAAVAVAAGYHLATGRIPVVYLQNSGIGNAINPLLSLADRAVYAIPILYVIGWRGEPAIRDEPQHVAQGQVMEELLSAVRLEYDIVDTGTDDYDGVVGRAVTRMLDDGRSHALLIRRDTFASYPLAAATDAVLPLSRARAIDILLEHVGADDLIVSTTGMASREVFDHRQRRGQSHDHDFLTVGSMGHCSQIALGIALHRPDRQVVCIDGDGAVIMHMGSLAIIGTQRPSNFRHVVINNGAHDSVGGQPTAARQIDLSAVARACGYATASTVTTEEGLIDGLADFGRRPGPSMLEVRVRSSAHTDAGRPTTTPVENKLAFMRTLGHERD